MGDGPAAVDRADAARTVPGVDALRSVGVAPLYEPEAFDAELWTGQSSRLVLMPAPGTELRTWQVMATASAARTDDLGQWWSEVFKEVLLRLRPRRVWLPTLSRLTRGLFSGADLLRTMEDTVDEVVLGGTPVALGPSNPAGMMMLGFAVQFAATERDEVVRRNLQGRVTAVGDRERFVHGPGAVPLGYRLSVSGRLEPHPAAGPVLELAARLLADPDRTPKSVHEVMSRAGLASPLLGGDGRWTWDADAVAAELAVLRGADPDDRTPDGAPADGGAGG